MKVAVVHNFHASEVPSGENVVVDAEVAALRRAGLEVQVAAVANDEVGRSPLALAKGAFTTATGMGPSPMELLDGFQPDIIHIHNLFPWFGRHWASRASAPIVTTQHSYRPSCANGYLFRDGAVCTLCPDGKRWSGVRYGCYRGSRIATVPLAIAGRRGAGADVVLRAARRVIVLSERSRQVFLGDGVPEGKLLRDWHFLPDALAGRPTQRGGSGWLVVARLTPEKGVDRLVAAWPRAKRLRIVGDGPLLDSIRAAARGKRIDVLGTVDRSTVVELMAEADGLVVPSLWYETFGLVYIEALAAGLPVLTFSPSVIADAVLAEGTGTVADWGDLEQAITDAEARFDHLRVHCRAVFEARYTETAFLDRRRALYLAVA